MSMRRKNHPGFTIIEIMLFLAVSGLMLVMGTVGITERTQNVQYSDSIRSIESFLNEQRTNITNGVNTRPDTMNCSENGSGQISFTLGPGEDLGRELDCVVNGKEFVLTTNDDKIIHTYNIATLNEESDAGASNVAQLDTLIRSEKAGRIEGSHNPHGIDWQTTFIGAVPEGSVSPLDHIGLLFVRSIFSSQNHVYINSTNMVDLADDQPLTASTYQRQSTGYHLCFKGADQSRVTDIFLNQGGTFELRGASGGPCGSI